MDDIGEELHELGGEGFAEKSTEEKRKLIQEALSFDEFAPSEPLSNPCEETHNHHNPAIDAHCQALSWDDGWTPVDETEVLTAYPEYVPTDEAIDTILEHSPILEIGAGDGYWAYVLENAGCEIIPTDMLPSDVETPKDDAFWNQVGTGENNFIDLPRTGPKSVDASEWDDGVDSDDYPNTPWCDVKIADHSAIKEYPQHTILSCHPEIQPWTEEMLEFMEAGQKIIFVGEWYPGADAMPMFFKQLTEWKLLDTFPVYDWASMHVHGYVFEKPTATESK